MTYRVKATHAIAKHDLARVPPIKRAGALAPAARRQVYFDATDDARGGYVDCPVFDRAQMISGDTIAGPAIVEQMDTTTVIPPGFHARVDAALNLYMKG